MTQEERKRFISLLQQEVVPALGCTEPIAVALASAKAAETLGRRPEKLDVAVSANLLKNGMGVMVPGTGEMGLGVAAAAGALGGKSALGLECLRDIDETTAGDARDMLEKNAVNLHLADNDELLYCLVTASAGDESAAAELAGSHDNITRVWRNGEISFEMQPVDGPWRRYVCSIPVRLSFRQDEILVLADFECLSIYSIFPFP